MPSVLGVLVSIILDALASNARNSSRHFDPIFVKVVETSEVGNGVRDDGETVHKVQKKCKDRTIRELKTLTN